MRIKLRRPLALLLSAAMTVTLWGTPVYAESEQPGTGLCEHHTAHTEDCGYAPAQLGDSHGENAEEIETLQAVAAETPNNKPAGEGTKQSPYQITNAEELAWFRDTVNSGKTRIHARLLNDIDLKEVIWVPTMPPLTETAIP